MRNKYMAYVGSYSYNGQAKGITVYDVDMDKGCFHTGVKWKWTILLILPCQMMEELCIQ